MQSSFEIDGIEMPSQYQNHPSSGIMDLVDEIRGYGTDPDFYETVEFVETKAINVNTIQKPGKENVGRFRGITKASYETVDKQMSKGWKHGSRPPMMLEGEDWLINGNNRHKWYRNNGYSWMPVDVFRIKDGFSVGDVIDELGLLYQPQPEGTSSAYEDYKARGILFVERKTNENIRITPELVSAWVDKFAANETKRMRTDLKKSIYNNTGKSAWLISTSRQDFIDMLVLEKGFIIRDSDYKLDEDTTEVHRLYEGSQKVFLRDFLPVFFDCASRGIKTYCHFYFTTTNIKNANALREQAKVRMQEVYEVISSLEKFDRANTRLRSLIEFGFRAPQIKGYDGCNCVKL